MALPKVVAVTGSTGFLGRHLVRQLSTLGWKVIELSRSHGYDICSKPELETVPPVDALVHLAARTFVPDSKTDSHAFFHVSLNGTLNALEICRRHCARMIFPSSYVYGAPKYLPVDERHPVRAWNPYAASKLLGEQLCRAYSEHYGVPVCILRLFNVYGPGQRREFLVPEILAGLATASLDLKDSRPRRDFVYVDDVVDALCRCLTRGPTALDVFNVGSGVSYSVQEVVDVARRVTGSKTQVHFLGQERPNEIMDVVADYSKIRRELGWTPQTDLQTGLEQIVRLELPA